ncbi:hypothetical protein IWW37_004198 [Coemansia sp. RSA 2050]|nr:hypothetical protein IWW37_004198 [Coemansia sp. RSA 2050]KAJ2731723.1 hypothetical protein IW152_004319 [Coemansia sp. BCRC 34962]
MLSRYALSVPRLPRARRLIHTSRPHPTTQSFLDNSSTADQVSVYQYAHTHSQPEPPVLASIRDAATARDPTGAQKMISPLQGTFMRHLVATQRPKSVLELGSYIGYSTIWLAQGLQSVPGSTLCTCEIDQAIAHIAEANIKLAGLADKVRVVNAPAELLLDEWDPTNKLDLVFVDANKSAYMRLYKKILNMDLLSDNGQIIVDNVLFHGRVHTKATTNSGLEGGVAKVELNTKGIARKIHSFNEFVANDPRTTQVLLPIFDGLLLIQKTK